MFKNGEDRHANIRSDKYEAWIVQDQALFTWLLSTIPEAVLPCMLSCKHYYQIWDQIHKYFTVVMKAKVHQLRAELKVMKKEIHSISEFVL